MGADLPRYMLDQTALDRSPDLGWLMTLQSSIAFLLGPTPLFEPGRSEADRCDVGLRKGAGRALKQEAGVLEGEAAKSSCPEGRSKRGDESLTRKQLRAKLCTEKKAAAASGST